eukprot:m.337500 g.337500  ORF g.337500 m.337500 type:complete len:231 (-) comp20552_c0_seq4:1130-1822(-)
MDFLLCASNEGALLVFYVLFHWKHTGPCPATPTYSHVGFVTNLIAHQYAVALLMNLCLRSAGRAFCVTACPGVVPLLKDMLIHEENAQVRSYIHGALYSLLGNATMREAALSVGIDKVVKQRLAESDEEMSMQLEYILRLMRETDDAAVDADGSVSDDEDDVDDVDDESDDLTACDESEGKCRPLLFADDENDHAVNVHCSCSVELWAPIVRIDARVNVADGCTPCCGHV